MENMVQREGVAVNVESYAKYHIAKKKREKPHSGEENRDCERRERDAQTDQKGNDLLPT